MPAEIERKFLVKGDAWRSLATGIAYCQGYIASSADRTVRVRVVGEQGFLTIKGSTVGITRAEFEYLVPLHDALELLSTLCDPPLIQKKRYTIAYAGLVWEVDEFEGDNQGLIVAEVELTDPHQAITLPDWIDREVSDDPRYFNANLAKHPFSRWEKGEAF
ncbi:CYTH domain-containing protein [Stenomitos frigidus]|uniref:Adenylate cyclase n=1 Tax=Stenomitos frigidus ULC18 TaxID=2107698 RepID=A0A2T1DX54_9CYAN|nr:CYTH domain-containing protein [Stenomitos frigidus]PSB25049.1 adenylate cyclase [Stenomitos frigidus ULC18]